MKMHFILVMLFLVGVLHAEPLKVVCSVPELGAIARQIGGDQVAVTVCVKPREDPHSLEARPSLIRDLAQADVWVQVGADLEVGWAPKLLEKARNPRVQPGADGFVDASTVALTLHRHAGPVDRAMGDVHPAGNPHFMLDPVNGMRVADLLAARFTALRPAEASGFEARRAAFRQELGAALVGQALAANYDAEKLARLSAAGTLGVFLAESGETDELGGWCACLAPFRGQEVVVDHDAWGYFTERFGLKTGAYLEPKPGMAPSTRHLAGVVRSMKDAGMRVIITSPYFPARHHQFVAKATGAVLAPLAHQVDSQPGTSTYLALIDYDVRTLAAALEGQAK